MFGALNLVQKIPNIGIKLTTSQTSHVEVSPIHTRAFSTSAARLPSSDKAGGVDTQKLTLGSTHVEFKSPASSRTA